MTETAFIAAEDIAPWNDAHDADKVAALVASMRTDGWTGAPVVVDTEQAMTGSHRIAAARLAGIEIPTVDIRALFADAGLDYDDTVAERGDRYEVIVRMEEFLPGSVIDEYGFDAH